MNCKEKCLKRKKYENGSRVEFEEIQNNILVVNEIDSWIRAPVFVFFGMNESIWYISFTYVRRTVDG